MRKYDSYKDSGIDWLGEVPKHWEVKRAKNIFDYINRGTSPSYVEFSDFKVINQATFSKSFFNEENIRYTNKISNKDSFTCKKDILIASTGGGVLGKVHYFDEKEGVYIADSHITILRGYKDKINTKYYYYFFSIHFHLINELLALGSTNQTELQRKYLFDFKLVYPKINEQTAIAQYLDIKTEVIDKKVSLLEKKIKGYKNLKKSLINKTITKGLNKNVKLKDSDIDWIGQIPQHWEVKRFKDVVTKYTTGGTPSTSKREYFEGDNVWISIGDINNDKFINDSSLYLTDEAIKDANILKTPKGSLLYSFKLSIGKMAFVTKDVYTNEAILSIFPNKNIDLEYYYFMLPIFMDFAATENIYGAKMLNQKLIANAFVLHPGLDEQQAIASYLDTKTSTIDKIVINIQTQITTLKALRKTLINDVVTGKIKVVD